MTKKIKVYVRVYVPQALHIAYDPKTGVANASMSFLQVRRRK